MAPSGREKSPEFAKSREFDWADPLLLEDELERGGAMVRDSARAYCQEKLLPRVLTANRRGALRPRDHERDGRAGLSRLDDRRLWLRRGQLRLVTG